MVAMCYVQYDIIPTLRSNIYFLLQELFEDALTDITIKFFHEVSYLLLFFFFFLILRNPLR